MAFKNVVTLKTGLGVVRRGHGKCYHSIERIMTSYRCSIVTLALSRVFSLNVEKIASLTSRLGVSQGH